MTSQKSSSERVVCAPFSSRLFSDTLKREWPHFLLYFLMLFFTCPIFILLMQNNSAGNLIETAGVTLVAMMSIIALFAGGSTMNWLCGRVPTNYYHSLPVRRETLYLIGTSVRMIYALLSLVINILITFAFLASDGLNEYIPAFSTYIGWAVMCFFFYYTVTLISVALSGTQGVRVALSLVNLFLLLGVYTSIVYIFTYSAPTVDQSFYMAVEKLQFICPPIRLFTFSSTPFAADEVILYVLTSIALYAVSMFLYIRRRSESSETPIVYGWAAGIYKYALMFVACFFSGLFFKAINDSDAWLYFGFVVGGTLTFMIVNTVIYKNAKMMFKRVYGLLIFLCVFIVSFILIGENVVGVDKYVPAPQTVSYVRAEIDGLNVDIEDKAVVEGFYELCCNTDAYKADVRTDTADMNPNSSDYSLLGLISYDYHYESEYYPNEDMATFKIVFYPKAGIPVAKRISGISKLKVANLLKSIADSDDYEKAYNDALFAETQPRSTRSINLHYCVPSNNNTLIDDWYNVSDREKTVVFNEIIYPGSEHISIDFDSFQKTAVGSMSFYNYSSAKYLNTYIYADNKPFFDNLPDYLNASDEYGYYTADMIKKDFDYFTDAAECVKSVKVTDNQSGVSRTYNDVSKITEILSGCAGMINSDVSLFTLIEPRYSVAIEAKTDYYYNAQYAEKYGEELGDATYDTMQTNTYETFFLFDKVPAIISGEK